MVVLFISLAVLGLAAIDPIGLAAMPVLLVQRRPFARSFAFLGGSFISLMVMGLLFARGFGLIVLHFEKAHTWLIPSAEVLAGLVSARHRRDGVLATENRPGFSRTAG